MNNETGVRDYVGIRKGLGGHSLGELEAQVMDIIWDLEPPVTATQVFRIMYPRRELSYSTVMLTMSKLAKKGILIQERSGPRRTDAFLYRPAISREEMARQLLEQVSMQVLRRPLDEALRELTR